MEKYWRVKDLELAKEMAYIEKPFREWQKLRKLIKWKASVILEWKLLSENKYNEEFENYENKRAELRKLLEMIATQLWNKWTENRINNSVTKIVKYKDYDYYTYDLEIPVNDKYINISISTSGWYVHFKLNNSTNDIMSELSTKEVQKIIDLVKETEDYKKSVIKKNSSLQEMESNFIKRK